MKIIFIVCLLFIFNCHDVSGRAKIDQCFVRTLDNYDTSTTIEQRIIIMEMCAKIYKEGPQIKGE